MVALKKEILGPLTMSLIEWASSREAPMPTETRKDIAALKRALEAVRAARAGLDIEASAKLRTATALTMDQSDGYHPERGSEWWRQFDLVMQSAIKLAERTLDMMSRPESTRRPPPNFDGLVQRLTQLFVQYRNDDSSKQLRSTKRGGFVSFAVDVIACMEGYPRATSEGIRNALRRLEKSRPLREQDRLPALLDDQGWPRDPTRSD